MRHFFLILMLVAGASFVNAQTKTATAKPAAAKSKKPAPKKKGEEQYEMKQYFMVFLKKGPNRGHDSATAAEIQKGHMAHLDKMAEEGKLDLAGPFMDDGDIRGICVYNVATLKEVEELAAQDPAVKSGRLIVEIHPWYSAKGASLK